MKPLPAPSLPLYDRVVYGDYTPRAVVEEVAQLLGFDAADVLSLGITADEVAVIVLGRDGIRTTRTLHRSVIR